MPPLPALSDLKSYLGLTTTGDDTLLTTVLADAVAQAERDTGRSFSATSNSTTRYSTNGEALVFIHDRPYADASRTVTWNGATMTEGTNVWFLPDRRDENVTTAVQLRYFDTSRPDWYKADPQWWDKNLDTRAYPAGAPNDLVITGIKGQPFPSQDVVGGILGLASILYWKAKGGGSNTVTSPGGEVVNIADLDVFYARWVERWRVRQAVSGV